MREEVSFCTYTHGEQPGSCTVGEVFVLKYREMAASGRSVIAGYLSVCVLCYPHVILHLKG